MASRSDAAHAYAREFKDAARELRQAAVAFLKVADRLRGDLAFKVIIPAAPEDVARLRELAELACDIVFNAALQGEDAGRPSLFAQAADVVITVDRHGKPMADDPAP